MNAPGGHQGTITIVVSTGNAHKLAEIQSILGPLCHCMALKDFPGAPAIVEDANTFEGNATKKAVELAKWLASQEAHRKVAGKAKFAYVLADDSGLEVDALNGAPGVNSARFAAISPSGNSPDKDNNAKLLRLLANVPTEQRTARFRCVLALTPLPHSTLSGSSPVCLADEAELSIELFNGTCEGRIAFEPRGRGGFGYDPLFLPEGMEQSFAELGEEAKNRISHRARALEKLCTRLKT